MTNTKPTETSVKVIRLGQIVAVVDLADGVPVRAVMVDEWGSMSIQQGFTSWADYEERFVRMASDPMPDIQSITIVAEEETL